MSATLAKCDPQPEDARLVTLLGRYDFSEAARQRIHLVASLPGIYSLRTPTPPRGARCTFRSAVAGTHRHHQPDADSILTIIGLFKTLYVGDTDGCYPLELSPMPTNPHDRNAIAVRLPARVRERCHHGDGGDGVIGFVPRDVAAWVSPLRESLGFSFRARAKPELLFSNEDALSFHYLSSSVGNLFTREGRDFVGSFCSAVGVARGCGGHESADDDDGHWAQRDGLAAAGALPSVVYPSVKTLKNICDQAKERVAYLDASGNAKVGGRVRLYGLRSQPELGMLHSLQSKPELNGKEAVVQGPPSEETGRVQVTLVQAPNTTISVKRENLIHRCVGTIVDVLPLPDGGDATATRVIVRLERQRRDTQVNVLLSRCVQGPPALSWPYMMSEKTWRSYTQWDRDQAARAQSSNRKHDGRMRACDIKPLRLSTTSNMPVKCSKSGVAAFMHSKIAQCWWDDGSGWLYVGSHNFSPAAWGKPLKATSESKGGDQRLWMANYELGLLRVEPPGAPSNDAAFWRGLRNQLGYKPGARFLAAAAQQQQPQHSAADENAGGAEDGSSPPATQRRIGALARDLHTAAGSSAADAVGDGSSSSLTTMSDLPPGEPLREVVVGVVDPTVEWLPVQSGEAQHQGGSTGSHDGRDAADEALFDMQEQALLRWEAEQAEANAQQNQRYALALTGL